MALRTVRSWLGEELRYSRMSFGLHAIAADLKSRALICCLGLPIVAQVRQRARPVRLRIRLKDQNFSVHLTGRIELAVLHEIAIEDEYQATDQMQARTIVDLGAHIGLATLRLLAAHPGARVVAVEADPVLASRLRTNVSGLPVTVVHAAVSAHEGERAFFRADRSSWTNSLEQVLPSQERITVPSITLAGLLEELELEQVDLLKIDIEGAEWEVLRDGIPDSVGSIVGEFHAQGGRGPSELLRSITDGNELNVQIVRDDAQQLVFAASRREY
jgi:FkbM family methyltransferase